jgi:hypothetical protein
MISCSLLFSVEKGIDLIDSRTEIGGISSESDSHNLEELVHTADETLRRVSKTFLTWATFVDNHTIWGKNCLENDYFKKKKEYFCTCQRDMKP